MNRTTVPHWQRGNFTRRTTQWHHCEPCSAVACGLQTPSLFVKPQCDKERCLSNCMMNIHSGHLYVAEVNNDLGRPGGNCYVHYGETSAAQTNKDTQPPEALVSVLCEAPCATVCYTWIWPSLNLRLFFFNFFFNF